MFTFFVRIIEISRKWKSDTFMYYPQQLQQCSCSFIIEFMNWYFMWFLRACVDPLHTLMWAPSWCTWGSVQSVRPHYLQNTHTLGILGGLASQFSCYRLIRFRLNYSHRCTAMTFNYCHLDKPNQLDSFLYYNLFQTALTLLSSDMQKNDTNRDEKS